MGDRAVFPAHFDPVRRVLKGQYSARFAQIGGLRRSAQAGEEPTAQRREFIAAVLAREVSNVALDSIIQGNLLLSVYRSCIPHGSTTIAKRSGWMATTAGKPMVSTGWKGRKTPRIPYCASRRRRNGDRLRHRAAMGQHAREFAALAVAVGGVVDRGLRIADRTCEVPRYSPKKTLSANSSRIRFTSRIYSARPRQASVSIERLK